MRGLRLRHAAVAVGGNAAAALGPKPVIARRDAFAQQHYQNRCHRSVMSEAQKAMLAQS